MAVIIVIGVIFRPVIASGFDEVSRVPVRSTSLKSLGYDARKRTLDVEFHSGALYRYREVPETVFTAFLKAESKGRFFSTSIRGHYLFERVRESAR